MNILTGILNLALAASFAPADRPVLDRCSTLVGSCEYYACVEEERISCGSRGYPMGYGANYCEKLSALEFFPARTSFNQQVFPADGNAWRDEVRTCLQEEMDSYFIQAAEEGEEVSCGSLKAFAFNSHPRCYTQNEELSFCELTPESVIKVGLTIAPQDLFSNESLTQVRDTAAICSKQIGNRLQSEPNFLVRLQLHKYRAIWESVALNPLLLNQLGGL